MVLQLLQQKLLTHPILFISAHLLREKPEYYRVLKKVTTEGAWEDYILFMLEAFYVQAQATIEIIEKIDRLYTRVKHTVKSDLPKIYTADLIEHVFKFPVTTPTNMADEIDITYQTASKYLKALQKVGVLQSKRKGTYHFFLNHRLLTIAKS